jgi:hypothetical protein
MSVNDEVRAFATGPVLKERRTRYLVLQCSRNSAPESLHAGICPDSLAGDYSHVSVSIPYWDTPWQKVSRLDDEMKRLMIDVVNRAYRFIHGLFDEQTCGGPLLRLADCDPLPRWNEATLIG